MKNYILLLLLAGQTAVAAAQDGDSRSLYLTKSLANDAITSAVVRTSAGGIVVSGQAGQAPRVEVYIKGNNGSELSKEEIKKRLDKDYTLDISVSGHEVRAIAKSKRQNFFNWRSSLSISFRIYVPQQCATDLETSGGGIGLDNLKGNEKFSTSGGGLTIDRLYGTIRGNTSGGGIHVSNSGDDISLETSGGGIEAKNCNGRIRLETSGGGITLENLKGTINAETSGGGVNGNNISGELITSTSGGSIDLKRMAGSISAQTSGGGLYAQMLKVGKYLKLESSAGNVDIELPQNQGYDLDLRGEGVSPSSVAKFNGQWEKERVSGKYNGGGIPVKAEASGGSVNIKFR
ncbi:DUF4097 family beta strand repeat-containing protein [Mucilaginibacter sp. SJ]|uniref:DUF4097 family beta strand repeat-containing protein n=1 Tax=Mucilaginibacter sp. SJ TaxID=3029053 RepID=UPI0023A9F5D7|nr:DUF4097 family beta strand repeat-containing protein [Mucilaginibacter sp. SJ]WDZ98726.1 DUF4097 family beta strand repeat-containing protein [Mucilaginibacter sp. SJ]